MRFAGQRLRWVFACSLLLCAPALPDVRHQPLVLDLTATSPAVESGTPSPAAATAIFGSGLPTVAAQPLASIITRAALSTGVPEAFLVKLLRQESGFNPGAVSPKGALGIAQFMPATAAERGLDDPFDPEKAIPKAAELLLELKLRYGNWGLAAAAYNAGAGRIDGWLLGRVDLPQETATYVARVTDVDVTVWAAGQRSVSLRTLLDNPVILTRSGEASLLLSLTFDRAPKAAGGLGVTSPAGGSASLSVPAYQGSIAPRRSGRQRLTRMDRQNPCAALLNPSTQCLSFSRY